jgi:hypothetical protein
MHNKLGTEPEASTTSSTKLMCSGVFELGSQAGVVLLEASEDIGVSPPVEGMYSADGGKGGAM